MGRRFLLPALLLLMISSGCTVWRASKNPSWKAATGAEQYERLMWKAIREKKWLEVETHLAPSFTGVTADGRKLDRAGWIEHWKSTQVKEFSMSDAAAEPNGADMVVSYELHLEPGSVRGLRVVSVWQQLKRGWVLIAQSVTPIA